MVKYFQKVISRDVPLIVTEMWSNIFIRDVSNFYPGIEFPAIFYIYRDGITESWRWTERFFGTLPLEVSAALKKQENLEKFRTLQRDHKVFSEKVRQYRLKNTSSPGLLKQVDELGEFFIKAGTGLALSYWPYEWNELAIKKTGTGLFSDEVTSTGHEIRKTDSLLDDVSEKIYQILQKLAIAQAWPRLLLNFITLNELREAVKTEVLNIKTLKQRQAGYCYHRGEAWRLTDLQKALDKLDIVLAEEELVKNNRELIGMSANPGFATGAVKIIKNREQVNKLQAGDILVAPMTTPWFIPAMRKAAAFVTDEGGVICHAAIIAREMNKPCVVGTKFATQVLKDGDLVEVDAGKGIVRKL